MAIAGTQAPIFAAARAFAERVDGRFLALDGRNHVTAFLAAAEIVTAIECFIGTRLGRRQIPPTGDEHEYEFPRPLGRW